MIDFQSVYIREVARLSTIDYGEVIRIDANPEGEDFVRVASVAVDGAPAHFIRKDAGSLLIVLPEGTSIENARRVTVRRSQGLGESAVTLEEEIPLALHSKWLAGSARITTDAGVLRVKGGSFSRAVQVQVNKKNQPFVIVGEGEIITTFPSSDAYVDTVDVILSSKSTSGLAFFSYMLGPSLNPVYGPAKLIQQIVKLLLTTKGSDVFHKDEGAGVHKLLGSNVNPNNTQGFMATLVTNVAMVGVKMQAAQLFSDLPADEKLGLLSVVNVGFDPTDPTAVDLQLSVTTVAGRQSMFSLLVGTAADTLAAFSGSQ